MRMAIVGTGRMGMAIRACARARGHEIVTMVGQADNDAGSGLTRERLAGAEVVIEFTTPNAALPNIRRLVELDLPVVAGTTGWFDALPTITDLVTARGGALLYAANFSIGLQILLRAAGAMARAARGLDTFDAAIVETHHTAKLDAPSGTALELQRQLRAVDPDRAFPITAIRLGTVPGIHRLAFDGQAETLNLEHLVRDRAVFAEGAVRAAEWLPGRPGIHTFSDMLFGETP